jgi:hypothetical protein
MVPCRLKLGEFLLSMAASLPAGASCHYLGKDRVLGFLLADGNICLIES